MTSQDNAKKVEHFFDKSAHRFDGIYTGMTGKAMRWLNIRFRKGIYMRYAETLKICGNVTGKRILDVGCGSGRIAIELALRGAEVVGLDVSNEILQIAQRIAVREGVADRCQFIKEDFLNYSPEQPFDIVLALGFFDYTPEAFPFLKRMHDYTSEMAIATFPKLWSMRTFVRKFRLTLLGCPVYFYTQSQINNLYQKIGFVVERIERQANAYFVVARVTSLYDRKVRK